MARPGRKAGTGNVTQTVAVTYRSSLEAREMLTLACFELDLTQGETIERALRLLTAQLQRKGAR